MWKEERDLTPASGATGGQASPPAFDHVGIGLSWFLMTRYGAHVVRHNGGEAGFRTAVLLHPDTQNAPVIMTNSDAQISRLVRDLSDAVLANSAALRVPADRR